MLSLSLFSSSQRISVALYEHFNLLRSFSTKIGENKSELFFLLLKKILKEKNSQNLKKIFIYSGPGSFTGLRSIKAIAQGLALVLRSEVYSINKFDCLSYNFLKKKKKILMFNKSSSGRFFYQFYDLSTKKVDFKSKIFFGNNTNLSDYFITLRSKHENLILVSDSKKNFGILKNIKKRDFKFFDVSAITLAEACFAGLGKTDLEIFYHNAYYEKT